MTRLVGIGAWGALLGGSGRILTSLPQPQMDPVAAELIWAAIDFGFLIGLAALFLVTEARLGWPGVIPFLIALAGAASIVGPDGTVAGMQAYLLGTAVLLIGTALISAALLWRDRRFVAPAILWLASLGLVLVGQLPISGAGFGAGFVVAGITMLRLRPLSSPASSSRGPPAAPS